jgi:phage FluMu protein Com
MKNIHRYQAEPLRLYDLMGEFLVQCPKCSSRAEIKIPQPFDYKNGALKCSSCHFSQKAIDLIRYKLVGKAKCHQCLEFLEIASIEGYKSIPTYVNIRCNSCQTINKVSENWEPYVLRYQDSKKTV